MEKSVYLFCKYEDDTVALKANKQFDFHELVRNLCLKWPNVTVNNVLLCYSIPSRTRILLRNQIDMDLMFSLADDFSLSSIDVNVEIVGKGCDGVTVNAECGRGKNKVNVSGVGGIMHTMSESLYNMQSMFVDRRPSGVNVGSEDFDDGLRLSKGSSSTGKMSLSTNWINCIKDVGQIFEGGAQEFRVALSRYSVEMGFKYNYVKNTKDAVVAYCKLRESDGCEWRIFASICRVNGFFKLRKFVKEHTCGVLMANGDCKRISYTHMAKLISDNVRSKPGLTATEVVVLMKDHYSLDVPYKKAWNCLEHAKKMIFGDQGTSYRSLSWYISAAMKTNEGSHIVLQTVPGSNRFRRLFVSFNASILGFKYCRPMLFLDGTFLKGEYKGILLSATAKDGNQGLFPLAYAVVDSENSDNWYWFLVELRKIIEMNQNVIFVSDRNVGLLKSLPQVFHGAAHYFCLEHLKNNLRDKLKGSKYSGVSREHLIWLLSECAHAHTESLFKDRYNDLIKKGGAAVQKFLKDLPLKCWTNAYGNVCRFGEMSSNAAESYNSWIRDARCLTITNMVDLIRIKIMTWHVDRREKAAKWSTFLCPIMDEELRALVLESKGWNWKRSSKTEFEIYSTPSVTVDLERRICSCRRWQMDGFPCAHAVLAIGRSQFKIGDFIDKYFYKSKYLKVYEAVIHPVPTILMNEFPDSENLEILPPVTKRQPGRPRTMRFRSRGERVKFVRCGRCGKIGHHNRKTCKEPIS